MKAGIRTKDTSVSVMRLDDSKGLLYWLLLVTVLYRTRYNKYCQFDKRSQLTLDVSLVWDLRLQNKIELQLVS